MRQRAGFFFSVIIGGCLAGSSHAAEKKISKSDLPPAVRKTADEQSKLSTVHGYSTDTEEGKLEYEMQMVTDGHAKDVTIAPDGQLMEVEEQLRLDALPAKARTALESKAGRGKIIKVESLTKQGSIVAYEAQVLMAGRHTEIQVGPDGSALDHPE